MLLAARVRCLLLVLDDATPLSKLRVDINTLRAAHDGSTFIALILTRRAPPGEQFAIFTLIYIYSLYYLVARKHFYIQAIAKTFFKC